MPRYEYLLINYGTATVEQRAFESDIHAALAWSQLGARDGDLLRMAAASESTIVVRTRLGCSDPQFSTSRGRVRFEKSWDADHEYVLPQIDQDTSPSDAWLAQALGEINDAVDAVVEVGPLMAAQSHGRCFLLTADITIHYFGQEMSLVDAIQEHVYYKGGMTGDFVVLPTTEPA